MAGSHALSGPGARIGRRRRILRRITLSSVLCFGQTAAAILWLKAAGPIGWIFAYCLAAEGLFFVRLLLSEAVVDRKRTRVVLDRLTKIGLGIVFLFGATVIVIGLDVTPASAYLAWFQLVQEGVDGGTLAYMFAVKFAFFGALFGGLTMVGSTVFASLNLAAVDLLICAVLLGRPGLAGLGVLLFLVSLGTRVVKRNSGGRRRAILAAIQVSVVALLLALPLSLLHFRNRLIDDLFNIHMENFVANVFPNFPFLYNVPGYGYTLESSRIGDRPALTSRPVFQVTAPAGSTIYIRTGVYDTYTGQGWELSRFARRSAERGAVHYESTLDESSLVPTERITFKVLIDFYSSLPHTIGTVAFRFPGEQAPPASMAGLGAGFILESPLRRGSEIVDLVARPGDKPPSPVIEDYEGTVFASNAPLPSAGGGEFVPGALFGPHPGLDSSDFGSARGVSRHSPRYHHYRELLSELSNNGGDASAGGTANDAGAAGVDAGTSATRNGDAGPDVSTGSQWNDNGDDDPEWAPPDVRGRGNAAAPYIRDYGALEQGNPLRALHGELHRAHVPSAKYGLQYDRYVLTAREREADLETGDVPDRLRALAYSLGAGKSQAATIRAIRSYLTENYKYSLSTSTSGPYDGAVSNFLFSTKSGFCVQFASALVILARLNGIPARYVTGFLANLPSGSDQMTVTGLAAHSWAETWNDELGWVTQEATPPMIAAAAGDQNVLQQYNPSDSSFTQRQLEAILGGRLSHRPPSSSSSSPASLTRDLTKIASPLHSVAYETAGAIVLLALLLLLVRFSYFRLAPVEVRLRRVVRQIARRSKSRGLPDPSRGGWREWSRGIMERGPARSSVADRAADIIHRSFFAGRRNGYRLLRRDVRFLRGLYRRLPRGRKPTVRALWPRAPVSSRS